MMSEYENALLIAEVLRGDNPLVKIFKVPNGEFFFYPLQFDSSPTQNESGSVTQRLITYSAQQVKEMFNSGELSLLRRHAAGIDSPALPDYDPPSLFA